MINNRRVYCCFQFFNELELLKIKLEELWSVVDYFVLSESTKTHSGNEKPLYYEQNKDVFSKYSSKIIHQIVTDTPDSFDKLKNMCAKDNRHKKIIDCVKNSYWFSKNISSYVRDTYEKEMLFLPLTNCSDNDIIILGDADEIPKASKVRDVIENWDDSWDFINFEHKFYWYYLNSLKDEQWYGNLALNYSNFKKKSFCEMRTFKGLNKIENGGWHFSYQGSLKNIELKINSWGEQSLNNKNVRDRLGTRFENFLSIDQDLFGRAAHFEIVPVNYDNHPQYLVDNIEEFEGLLYKGEE